MAISEERFKILDDEFNVPIADLLSITDSNIKNFVENIIKVFPELVSGMIDSVVDTALDSTGLDGIVKSTDIVKDLKLPLDSKQLTSVVDNMVSEVTARGVEFTQEKLSAVTQVLSDKLQNVDNKLITSTKQLFSTADGLVNQFNTIVDTASTQLTSLTDHFDFTAVNDIVLNTKALSGLESITSELKTIDPVGYKNILNSSITSLATNKNSDESNSVTFNSYNEMVNSLTNSKKPAITNDDSIERIVIAITKEASRKNIYGVFTAFVKKYGNKKGMINAGNILIEFAINSKKHELSNEIISSDIASELIYQNNSLLKILNKDYIDESVGEQHYNELYNKLKSKLNIVNPNWDIFNTSDNEFISAANVDLNNSNMRTLLQIESLSNETSLDSKKINNEAYLYTASFFDNKVNLSLDKILGV